MKLTTKQKKFCDYYLKTGNATESAVQAGYSKKTAKVIGSENLAKPYIMDYINEKLAEIGDKTIADATEIMQYLTKGMRGELYEDVVVTEGLGGGVTESRTIKKRISLKEAVKCAELLGKRYRLFTDRIEADVQQQIIFTGENEIED